MALQRSQSAEAATWEAEAAAKEGEAEAKERVKTLEIEVAVLKEKSVSAVQLAMHQTKEQTREEQQKAFKHAKVVQLRVAAGKSSEPLNEDDEYLQLLKSFEVEATKASVQRTAERALAEMERRAMAAEAELAEYKAPEAARKQGEREVEAEAKAAEAKAARKRAETERAEDVERTRRAEAAAAAHQVAAEQAVVAVGQQVAAAASAEQQVATAVAQAQVEAESTPVAVEPGAGRTKGGRAEAGRVEGRLRTRALAPLGQSATNVPAQSIEAQLAALSAQQAEWSVRLVEGQKAETKAMTGVTGAMSAHSI